MAYAASIERLLETLHVRAPAKVDALALEKRRVPHGLLSVGLKLHCLGDEHLFSPLFAALGGERRVLDHNVFKRSRAKFCLVLPPVGSARAAILLLECIEQYTGCKVFNNRNIQLQVCSPGRLSRRHAALHAIGFYLSSDTLRQYALDDFATTVSDDYYYHRGKRIVIYDAGSYGDFDSAFAWWARTAGRTSPSRIARMWGRSRSSGKRAQSIACPITVVAPTLRIRKSLPFLNGRTDILVGPGSKLDIHNVNLIATLLVHAQSSDSDGYWSSLGELFANELVSLLDRHLLAGLIEAPWICLSDMEGNTANDHLFLSALQELTAYAAAEATRLKQATEKSARISSLHERDAPGILGEMQKLLATYRSIVTSISEEEHGDAT